MKRFEQVYSVLFLVILAILLSSFTNITDDDMLAMGFTDEQLLQLQEDVVCGQKGLIDFSACHAQIEVPQEFIFLDEHQSKKLLVDYWGNPKSHITNMIGVLVPNTVLYFYQISVAYVLTYDNSGYIEDEDANSINYTELLKQMQKASEEENKSLPVEQRFTIKDWAVPPHYNQSNHVLIWARTLSFSGGESVNYDMRILGKEGFVSINAVVDPEFTDEVVAKEADIIRSLSFYQGFSYTDFNPSKDKISDWTIGGLVAGGILAKSGFFAKLGVLLLKFWKLIVIGIVGLCATITKFFKRNQD